MTAPIDTSTARQIQQQLESDHGYLLELLKRLVEAESPSTVAASQSNVQQLLRDEREVLDYRSHQIPGRETGGYLVGTPKSRKRGAPVQVLLGHCDTVWPLGTLQTMPIEIRDGRMTGPGVFDMKAGLVQMIGALRAIERLELVPEVTPILLINSDEEIGGAESKTAVIRLSRVADRVLVVEPALGPTGKLKTARKGVGQFTVEIAGKAAHSGLDPGKGISAILELSHVIQKLFALNDLDNGISVNVGIIEGGTRANVVAAQSRAQIDIRVVSVHQADEIEAAVRAIGAELEGTQIEFKGGFEVLPLERTPRNRVLWDIARESAALIDLDLEETLAGGASDGNLASQYAATLDGLGPVGDGAHAAHEFIQIDSLVERGALLTMMLLAPCLSNQAGA